MQLKRASNPWLAISRRVSSRWASGQVMTTRSMSAIDPRLLEDVDDERLAAEQEELLRERSPDALADPAGEHDHPDLHAVLRVRVGPRRSSRRLGLAVGQRVPRGPSARSRGYHPATMEGRDPRARRPTIVSIRWERVQLILDVRPLAGTTIDPGWAPTGEGRWPRQPPADPRIARGRPAPHPDQRDAGSRPAAARPRTLAAGGPIPGGRGRPAGRASSTRRRSTPTATAPRSSSARGVFRVTPLALAGDGTLALEVAFEPGHGFDRDARPPRPAPAAIQPAAGRAARVGLPRSCCTASSA